MISEVAGDPTTLPGLRAEHENGPRRPGASPPMRMTASWFDPQRIDRIQGRGARSAPHLNGELASDFVGCNCRITRDVKPSPLSTTVRRPAPLRPIAESANQQCEVCRSRVDASCRRARGRQGRCAPLTRWPEGGPILDRRCARRRSERAAGAEEWLRRGRTKELEKEKEWKRMKIAS